MEVHYGPKYINAGRIFKRQVYWHALGHYFRAKTRPAVGRICT